jgi:DNA-nicking Smr family endonuclease
MIAGGDPGDDGGEGGEGGGDEESANPTSFAELIGETTPLAPAPARAASAPREALQPRSRTTPLAATDFRRPDPSESRLAAAPGVSDAQLFALGRGEPEPEEKIDLHGLRREAAALRLADRVESARARNLRCVVVVHGRGRGSGTGEAILRDAVPDWLSKNPTAKHVLGFAPAPSRFGGEGAMLVLLRRA